MRFRIVRKAEAETRGEDIPTEELFTAMGNYMEEMARSGVLLSGAVRARNSSPATG